MSTKVDDILDLIDGGLHGIAATCPRHGPTRGGTCMKCARGPGR